MAVAGVEAAGGCGSPERRLLSRAAKAALRAPRQVASGFDNAVDYYYFHEEAACDVFQPC